ncbi:MAG: UTP--glucose-1-phosphate uridylyltransferase [Lachnospiraceae bacterium]|nr:UTP--glucose-1-phosphate uridylyltransferase [Lachnospiraceae bacterium]
MTRDEAYKKLKVHGQEHLLRMYDNLTAEEQEALLERIDRTDFSYLDHFKEKEREIARGVITPLKALEIPEILGRTGEFEACGIRQIREGRLAAVLLAGGMGTRLGISGPKGACDIGITRPLYIFECLMNNMMRNAAAAGVLFQLFVMTSEKNDAETRRFFEEHDFFGYDAGHVHFFVQEMAPAVDEDGHVLLETPSEIAVSPNGNGGWFRSMEKAGYTQILKDEGIEWLNVFAVDNVLQNICDPVFFGAVLESGCASGSKVVRKVNPQEKVGVMCLEDGRPSVIEYYEMSDAMRSEKDADGNYAYNFGVTLNYLFRVKDLEAAAGASMPLHFAHKKVPYYSEDGCAVSPDVPNGWKFEYFILDLIHELPDCLPFEVDRRKEFAPVKNASGTDSVDTARELLRENGVTL